MRITDKAFFGFLRSNPRSIFLLDGVGAAVSTVMLSVVLAYFDSYIGLSKNTLLGLGAIAFLFCIYSFSCFLFSRKKRPLLLALIMYANAAYAILTFTLLLVHFREVTFLGYAYFLGELAVLALIVRIEFEILQDWRAGK